jgi:hypothetical protein
LTSTKNWPEGTRSGKAYKAHNLTVPKLVKHYERRSTQGEEANLDEVEDISEETPVVDLEKSCQKVVKRIVKKLSKFVKKVVKKVAKKLPKSCQKMPKKVFKKFSKNVKIEN